MSETKKTRKEELEAELEALAMLENIEDRRTKSLRTHEKAVHKKYDELRAQALNSLPPEQVKKLNETDPAQKAYLDRVGEPVDDKDIVEVE